MLVESGYYDRTSEEQAMEQTYDEDKLVNQIKFTGTPGNRSLQIISHNGNVTQYAVTDQAVDKAQKDPLIVEQIKGFFDSYISQAVGSALEMAYDMGKKTLQWLFKSQSTPAYDKKIQCAEKITQASKLVQATFADEKTDRQQFQKAMKDADTSISGIQPNHVENSRKVTHIRKIIRRKKLSAQQKAMQDESVAKKRKASKQLFKSCRANLKRCLNVTSVFLDDIYIICEATKNFSFENIWQTHHITIFNSLQNIKQIGAKVRKLQKVLRELQPTPSIFNNCYLLLCAAIETLLAGQILIGSKYAILYNQSDAMTPEEIKILMQYKVAQKDSFSGIWELFLTNRMYDKNSWTPQKKVELKKIAINHLNSKAMKRFTQFYQTVQAVQRDAVKQKDNEMVGQFLQANLKGKSKSLIQNVYYFFSDKGKKALKYCNYIKNWATGQLSQKKQQTKTIQNQVLAQQKKMNTYIKQKQTATAVALANQVPLNKIKQVAEQQAVPQAQAIAVSEKFIKQLVTQKALLQATAAVVEAANQSGIGSIKDKYYQDKLQAKQLTAQQEKQVQNIVNKVSIDAKLEDMFSPAPVNKEVKKISKNQARIIQAKNQAAYIASKLNNLGAKLEVMSKYVSIQLIAAIKQGHTSLAAQIKGFEQRVMKQLNQRMLEYDYQRQESTNFKKRIEILQTQQLLKKQVTQNLSGEVLVDVQLGTSSKSFLTDIQAKVLAKIDQQKLTMQTLVKGIEQVKAGKDRGAIAITSSSMNYLTQISFNSFATTMGKTVGQLKELYQSGSSKILNQVNTNYAQLSYKIHNLSNNQQKQSKSILQGISCLTTTVQVEMSKVRNSNIEIIASINTSLAKNCSQVMSMMVQVMEKINVSQVQCRNYFININSYLQNMSAALSQQINSLYNKMQNSFLTQLKGVRATQQQILTQLQITRDYIIQQNKTNSQLNSRQNAQIFYGIQTMYNKMTEQHMQGQSQILYLRDKDRRNMQQLNYYKNQISNLQYERNQMQNSLNLAYQKINEYKDISDEYDQILKHNQQQDRQIALLIGQVARTCSLSQIKNYKISNIKQMIPIISKINQKLEVSNFNDIQQRQQIYDVASQKSKREGIQIGTLRKQVADLKTRRDDLQHQRDVAIRQQKTLLKKLESLQKMQEIRNQDNVNAGKYVGLKNALDTAQYRLQYTDQAQQYVLQTFKSMIGDTSIRQWLQKMLGLRRGQRFEAQKQNQVLKKQIQHYEQKLRQEKSKAQSLKKNIKELQLQSSETKSNLNVSEQSITRLKLKMRELQSSRNQQLASDKRILQLQSALKSQQSKLSVKTNEYCDLTKSNIEITTTLTSTKAQLKQTENKTSQLQASVRVLEEQLKRSIKRANQAEGRLKKNAIKQKTTTFHMGDQYSDVHDGARSLKQQVAHLKKSLATQNVIRNNYEKQIQQLKTRSGNQKNQIQKLTDDINSQKNQLNKLKLAKGEVSIQLQNIKSKLLDKQSQARQFMDKYEVSQRQKTLMKQNMHKIELQQVTQRNQLMLANRALKLAQMNDQSNQTQIISMTQEIKNLKRIIVKIENDIAEKTRSLQQKEQKITSMKQFIKNQKAKLTKQTQQKEALLEKQQTNNKLKKQSDYFFKQLEKILAQINYKNLALTMVKRKIIDQQLASEANYYQTNLKKIQQLKNLLLQINAQSTNWPQFLNQVRRNYGFPQSIVSQISQQQIRNQTLTMIEQFTSKSKKKIKQLTKQKEEVEMLLSEEKEATQQALRDIKQLDDKFNNQKLNYEENLKKKESDVKMSSKIILQLQDKIKASMILITEMNSKISNKQMQLAIKAKQYQELTIQKQHLALALSLQPKQSVIKSLETIANMFGKVGVRNKQVSDQTWIKHLIAIIQNKRKRVDKAFDESDEQQPKPRKKRNMIIQVPQDMKVNLVAQIGSNQPPPDPPIPPKNQMDIEFKPQKKKADPLAIDVLKLQKDLKLVSKFLTEFEHIFIFIIEKIMIVVEQCVRILTNAAEVQPQTPYQSAILKEFVKFMSNFVSWVFQTFQSVKFEIFAQDYLKIKTSISQFHQLQAKGQYLISGTPKLRFAMKDLQKHINVIHHQYSTIPSS